MLKRIYELSTNGGATSAGEGAEGGKEANFSGRDGATSLKAEIVARIPRICDASKYREARRLLQMLGGADALVEELTFAGFVDPTTEQLTVNERPFNVFAQIAEGVLPQPSIDFEQAALGPYQHKFKICANRPDNDLHWDSTDPIWIPKASMARRHRFLTTKDLHWQWFNMLVVGLVPQEYGGADIHQTIAEVEEMRAAATLYTKNMGWSDNIGLFVNIFGHNNVNSLFIHVLDMNELGPGFGFQSFKNCPLDAVLKVLHEEAAVHGSLGPEKRASVAPKRRQSIRRLEALNFFFRGTDGATSVKAELVGRVPVMKDAASFREARRLLMEEFGGSITLRTELNRCGFIEEGDSQLLSTGDKPFNIFARIAAGKTQQPGMEDEQAFLGNFQDRFVVCKNRPENDEHWDSNDEEWIGKASMSRRHRFLSVKDLHWQWFNMLTFGLVPEDEGGASLEEAYHMIEDLKQAALLYAKNAGWGGEKGEFVGLFFHVFGHNSVNSLHLHILDMRELGPTFWKYEYKNMPLDCGLKVLREAAEAHRKPEDKLNVTSLIEASTIAQRAAENVSKAAEQMYNQFTAPAPGPEVLTVNVGGEYVTLPREMMLMAPPESLMNKLFQIDWNSRIQMDANGKMFLNFPAKPFKAIIDHFRMLYSTPMDDVVQPLIAPRDCQREVEDLSDVLGVSEYLGAAHWGRGERRSEDAPPKRPRPWCARRRRPTSPPPCFGNSQTPVPKVSVTTTPGSARATSVRATSVRATSVRMDTAAEKSHDEDKALMREGHFVASV